MAPPQNLIRQTPGTITLEVAIVLPLLSLIILGGAGLASQAGAKAALQMTVARAARELAAGRTEGPQTEHTWLVYTDFSETYGLDRFRVKMLAGRQGNIIRAGACYQVAKPTAFAGLLSAPPQPEPNVSFDELLRRRCAGRRRPIVARAAYWLETAGTDAAMPLEVIEFAPNPVDISGSRPDHLRRVSLVLQAAEPSTCEISVQYKSGSSRAAGVVPPRRSTDALNQVSWTWNVGTNTTAGAWPITVICENKQWVNLTLGVINAESGMASARARPLS